MGGSTNTHYGHNAREIVSRKASAGRLSRSQSPKERRGKGHRSPPLCLVRGAFDSRAAKYIVRRTRSRVRGAGGGWWISVMLFAGSGWLTRSVRNGQAGSSRLPGGNPSPIDRQRGPRVSPIPQACAGTNRCTCDCYCSMGVVQGVAWRALEERWFGPPRSVKGFGYWRLTQALGAALGAH